MDFLILGIRVDAFFSRILYFGFGIPIVERFTMMHQWKVRVLGHASPDPIL
jgi:hypothetical protein